MNKFKFYFVVISIGMLLFSCTKDDTTAPVPVREFSVQYEADSSTIANYLKTHYIEKIINNPGFADDQDITITKIPTGANQPSIFSLLNSPTYPKLLLKDISLHNIIYNIYYLELRENNPSGKSPSRVDQVLTSYSGSYLSSQTTTTNGVTETITVAKEFETVKFPQTMFALDAVIRGWAEIFPLFKTGTYSAEPSPNPATFLNFGAGVMFIPSGLAYFNSPPTSIPSYSPLVFSFKLYDLKRADQDMDGILSIYEDTNADGDFTNDDTDGDGRQDYRDSDDDGDGYLTKNEIKDPITGLRYSFDLIPTCGSTGNGKKKHLDSSCH